MLVREHPDVAEVKFKFERWHHHVNYTVFKKQKLIKRNELDLKKGVNDYGMKLVKLKRK
jgi:hypothetical protein